MPNPQLTAIEPQSAHMIKVTFNTPVGDSALNPDNYQLSGTGQGSLPDYPDFVERVDDTSFNLIWISAGIDKNVEYGNSVQLDAIVPGSEPYVYSWSPSYGLDDATIMNPTATPSETTTYTLTVTRDGDSSESGAITDSVEIKVLRSSITQYDITWTFDRLYECGQFVTGDWWVVGPVTVASVSPAPVILPDSLKAGALRLRNGSMVNPIPGVYSQSYDQRATGWGASTVISFPFFLNTDKSLVSSESYTEGATRPTSSYLKSACVLTCLSNKPPEGSFRPAYTGTTKTIYSSLSLNTYLLPNLPAVSLAEGTKGNFNSIDNLLPLIRRPWIDHSNGAGGFYIFPVDNMSNYGRELSDDIGRISCILLLDEQIVGNKTELIKALIQNGIDHYGTLLSGGTWPEDGGHCSGRKFSILFAGLMLNDSNMLSIGNIYPPESNTFGDDSQTFIISETDIGRSLLVTGNRTIQTNCCSTKGNIICPNSCITTATEICFKCSEYNTFEGNYLLITDGIGQGQQKLVVSQIYKWIDDEQTVKLTLDSPLDIIPVAGDHFTFLGYQSGSIGIGEWGGAHTTIPLRDNPSWKAHYRCSSTSVSWNGWILAARILGLKTIWNNDAIFEYIDRYMTGGPGTCSAQGYRSWSTFTARMWDAYRSSY